MVSGKRGLQNLLSALVCLLACYAAIRYIRFAFVAIGLPLLIAAFQLGGFGTSVLSLLVGLFIIVLWALGLRPIGLDSSRHLTSLSDLPIIALLATVMPPVAVGLGTDARRRIGSALRASERRFRESMDRSTIGMLIADLEGIWVYTNIALQKMLGYSAGEFRALPPPGGPRAWRIGNRARHAGVGSLTGEIEFYDVEQRFRHKDGHWVWIRVAVSLVRDEEDTPLHLTPQIESLEGRRRAEERLAEERERLRATLLAINDAVSTTDTHGCITYLNPAAVRSLGVELQAAEARRLAEILLLTDAQSGKVAPNLLAHSAVTRKCANAPTPACCIVRMGPYRRSSMWFPQSDSQGLVIGTVVVLRDASAEFEQSRELNHRARHDALTGLANRLEFQQRLQRIFQRARYVEIPAGLGNRPGSFQSRE